MAALITNKKRSCTVSVVSGNIKLDGGMSLEPTNPKVTDFNLTVFVNTGTEAENFTYAGNANRDGAFNMNLHPDFAEGAQDVSDAVFALIAEVEQQYAL